MDRYLRQVFVDKELNHHAKKLFSSFLRGRNSNKMFPAMTGCGDNSKSILVRFLQAILGNYCVKIPASYITDKQKNSANASPEIARSKGAYLLLAEETEDEDILTVGLIKRLTGGDSFFARFLHDNGGEIEPFFKLVLVCNKLPIIANPQKAIIGRFRVIPFLSVWTDREKAPESEEEQFRTKTFVKDQFFDKKIPQMAPALLWILREYYEKYMSEGLKDPPCVKEETKRYWDENDLYSMFIEENIENVYKGEDKDDGVEVSKREPDTSQTLMIKEIYEEFKIWYKDTFPNNKFPSQPKVKLELIRLLGPQNKHRWVGVRLMQKMPNGATNGILNGGDGKMEKKPE